MNTLNRQPVRLRSRSRPLQAALFATDLACLALALVLLRDAQTDTLPTFTPLPSPDKQVSGISWDGSSLWITIDGGQMIYQVDEKTNTIRRKIPFFEKATGGSAWDGRYLWQLAWVSKKIHKVDLKTGAVLHTFPTPGKGMCSGMTFDGRYLWVANFDDRKIYQIDQNREGAIIRTISGQFEATGLAWDGKYLWNGMLVGTQTHDEPTPYNGFFAQRDLTTMQTLAVVPVPGIGPGTSDWLPGASRSRRFWWYDGFYNRILRVDLRGRGFRWGYAAILAALCLFRIGLSFATRSVWPAREG